MINRLLDHSGCKINQRCICTLKDHANYVTNNFLHLYSDEHRKKEVRITLHHEDIKKLNYLITYTDECRTRNKESFSFDRVVKKFRRINLPKVRHTAACGKCDDVMMM